MKVGGFLPLHVNKKDTCNIFIFQLSILPLSLQCGIHSKQQVAILIGPSQKCSNDSNNMAIMTLNIHHGNAAQNIDISSFF